MPESKNRIVFVTNEQNEHALYEHDHFYAFDEDFISDDNEKEVSLDKACGLIKIKDQSLIAQPLNTIRHSHVFAAYASLGCRVYRAGGNYHGCDQCYDLLGLNPLIAGLDYIEHTISRHVDFWDTIKNCWTPLPLMNVGRFFLHLHTLQGKLFAVGGYESCDEFRFIEMFDEDKGDWVSYSYPPCIVKLDLTVVVSAAVECKGFILFGSFADDSFYVFWPSSGSWERMNDLPFDHYTLLIECRHSPTVVVGNHLLWLDSRVGSTLVGFNIDSGKYFKIDLAFEGLLPCSEIPHFCPHLLHVENGELALVWRDCCSYVIEEGKGKGKGRNREKYNHRESSAGIHCYRFSIDFDKALDGEKCCELMLHQKCIGPNVAHQLSAAFVAEVGVAVGNASNSNNTYRGSQRRKPHSIRYPTGLENVEVAHSTEKIDHAGKESMIWE